MPLPTIGVRRLAARAVSVVYIVTALGGVLQLDAQAPPLRSIFPMDLGNAVIAGSLPFDVPFFLSTPANASLRGVQLWVGRDITEQSCRLLSPPPGTPSSLGSSSTDVTPDTKVYTDRQREATQALDKAKNALKMVTAARAAAEIALKQILDRNPRPLVATIDSAKKTLADTQAAELSASIAQSDAQRTLNQLRLPAEPTSAWYRTPHDSVTTLLLDVGPLEPNRDYRFCAHALRTPTDKDTADFAAAATKNLTEVLRQFAVKLPGNASILDSLQLALIDALPSADSLVVLDPKSIFLRPANDPDRGERLTRLSALYSAVHQTYNNRTANLVKASADVKALGTALRQIAADAVTLAELGVLADDPNVAKVRGGAFADAGLLANRLATRKLTDADQGWISDGSRALGDFGGLPPAGRDTSKIWTSADLKSYFDTYQRDEQLLMGLRDLIDYKIAHPPAPAQKADADRRDNFRNLIDAILMAVKVERIDLVNTSATLDQGATPIRHLVDSLRTLDLRAVAVRGTTSQAFQARAQSYVSLDVGLVFGNAVRQIVPYFGANIYFRPVNREAPIGFSCWTRSCFLRRLAATVGVTATNIKQENRLDDLFNTHSLIVGGGLRLSDYWRVTAASLILKTYPNGVDKPAKTTGIPAIATSLDIDVVTILGKVGSLFIPNLK